MTQDKDGQYVSYHDYASLLDSHDRLRAELAASESRNTAAYGEMAELRAELAEARRLLDEVNADAVRLADFYSGSCLFAYIGRLAAPVPAQPAVPDDVAMDAARYRWMRDFVGIENADAIVDAAELSGDEFDKHIDAAILSATEGRSNG